MKTNKAAGEDDLPTELLKWLDEDGRAILTDFLNQVFNCLLYTSDAADE